VATTTFTVNTPTITLNPAMGAPNTLVAISGTHFAAGDTIKANSIRFGASPNDVAWNTGVGGVPGDIMIDASGNWNTSLYVPANAAIGNNPVTVTSFAGTTASAVFAVGQRVLTLTPASGPLGTTVVIQGTNMTATPPNNSIAAGQVKFAGQAWNTTAISIDSLGNMSPTPLTLTQPPLTLTAIGTGPQSVTATDLGGITAVGTFTVTQPTITISPTTGYMGNTLTVTGAGWLPTSAGLVQVKFNGVFVWSTTPNADGTFSGGFTIPVTAVASNTVSASDLAGNVAPNQTFLLGPQAMTIAPTSGPAGTKVTVTGVGFQPLSALSVLTIGGASVLPATPVTTDNTGKFTTSFTVPGLAQIAQTVTAKVGAIEATTFFTITVAPATIDVQLASISSQLVIVWRYQAGNWTFYDPTDVVGSTLTSLQKNAGYFVKVSAACTLTYLGSSIPLDADWNNIGWPG
jgi:hypothetical protein